MSILFALIATAISFTVIWSLKNKKISFSKVSLVALILGLIAGSIVKNEQYVFSFIGSAYVNLIKMLVLPLVITSIIASINSNDHLYTLFQLLKLSNNSRSQEVK